MLVTERLLLRRLTEADVDLLVELDSDPEVMRFLNEGLPASRKIIERTILPGYIRIGCRFPGFGYWAANSQAGGEFADLETSPL